MKASAGTVIGGLTILALACSLAAGAREQGAFVDAEGRDTVLLVCSQCHSLNRIMRAQLTTDEWEFIVYDMIARGAPVHKEDIPALKKYLQDNFAVDQ